MSQIVDSTLDCLARLTYSSERLKVKPHYMDLLAVDLLAIGWRRNGFVYNISTRQDVVDKSVDGKML